MTGDPFDKYIGRMEVQQDFADSRQIKLFCAAFDLEAYAQPADSLPPLTHWLHFRPLVATGDLATDGHPKLSEDGLLPISDLHRRMWAGSRIRFLKPIQFEMALTRRSTISSIERKLGRTGEILLVTVDHVITDSAGTLLLHEEQDIIYRADAKTIDINRSRTSTSFRDHVDGAIKSPDMRMLFRYSALTFNAHRIHYDRDYARDQEGYPGLVVHGPLVATLLLQHLLQSHEGSFVTSFSFRAVAPAIEGEPLALNFTHDGDSFVLQAVGPSGIVMLARAELKT